MESATDLDLTTVKCFKGDLSRVKRLGERLEAENPAGGSIYNQHTINRALTALERELEAKAAA